MSSYLIPYTKHSPVTDADVREVEGALRSSDRTRGPRTRQFEGYLADLLFRDDCVLFCNGTAAIYAAARTFPF